MDSLAIDLTHVVAIVVLGALLMVPVVGLTLRYTLPPILDAVARTRRAGPVMRAASGAAAEADGSGVARLPRPAPRRAPEAASAGGGATERAVAVSL